MSFSDTPLSEKTLNVWDKTLRKNGIILDKNDLIKYVQSNPNPDDIEIHYGENQAVTILPKYEPVYSEFVLEIMKQEGITNDMDGVIDEADEL